MQMHCLQAYCPRDILAKRYLQAGQNEAAVEQSRKAFNTDPKTRPRCITLSRPCERAGRIKMRKKDTAQIFTFRTAHPVVVCRLLGSEKRSKLATQKT
jgi:hypothetical protein